MPKNWPNKHLNLFGCPRVNQINIQIYLDAQELTKRLSEYIQKEEKPWKLIWIIYTSYFIKKYLIVEMFVLLLKQVKAEQNCSQIVQIDQGVARMVKGESTL